LEGAEVKGYGRPFLCVSTYISLLEILTQRDLLEASGTQIKIHIWALELGSREMVPEFSYEEGLDVGM